MEKTAKTRTKKPYDEPIIDIIDRLCVGTYDVVLASNNFKDDKSIWDEWNDNFTEN